MVSKFLKNETFLKLLLYIMFGISSIFTISVFISNTPFFISKLILSFMGISLEGSKILLIPYIYKLKKLKNKRLCYISSFTLCVLISISIYANIQYTYNINNELKSQNQIETIEYKNLMNNVSLENDNLNELKETREILKNDIEQVQTSIEQVQTSIEQVILDKSNKLKDVKNDWAVKSNGSTYDESVKALNDSREQLNNEYKTYIKTLNDNQIDIEQAHTSIEQVSKKLEQVDRYEKINIGIFNNTLARSIFGIIFELVSILLFIINESIKYNIVSKKPVEIIKCKLSTNTEKYLKIIKENIKDKNIISSDNELIKKSGLSKYMIQNAKKELFDNKIIYRDIKNKQVIYLRG